MNLSDFKDKISLELATQPQRQAKAMAGIGALESGIAELAALGYRVVVVEEFGEHVAPKPEEFPKMLYRSGDYPREVTVEDEEGEAKAREQGYAELNPRPVPQPAVDSQPVNPQEVPPASLQAQKPTVTDKDALQRNIDAGVGASKPNLAPEVAASKTVA